MNKTVLCIIMGAVSVVNADTNTLRIVNGREATPGEFPYAVRIQLHAKNTSEIIVLLHVRCTGAAITSTWVLSNANCATKSKPLSYDGQFYETKPMIQYGNPELNPSEIHDIAAVLEMRTPGTLQKIPTKDDDIALLYTEPMKLQNYARINAIDYSTLAGLEVKIIGFGKMKSTRPKGTMFLTSSALDKPLQVMDRALLTSCTKLKLVELKNHVLKLCAVPSCSQPQSVFHGDSGAPVVLNSTVIGIVSKVTDQLLQNMLRKNIKYVVIPNIIILTPISPYVDWIERQITNGAEK